MHCLRSIGVVLSITAALAGSFACDTRTTTGAAPAPATQPASTQPAGAEIKAVAKAEPGHFTGRITLADGSPISLKGVKYKITIVGVTAAGERSGFFPVVAPDGTFKLRLPTGLYSPAHGTITYPFEGKNYTVRLDPIDPVEGMQEGAQGIVQNFVWRLTGPRPDKENPDVNNATHWFGVTYSHVLQPYRRDTGKSVLPPPDKTDIIWTLKPVSKLADGSEAKPLTIERKWRDSLATPWDALNDVPPANYEVSAIAKLPDGSTKPVLLTTNTREFKASASLILEPYVNGGEIVAPTIYWVVE
jgi:hypothetical protein